MNRLSLTASTAGTLSTAKSRSAASIATTTASSGVAITNAGLADQHLLTVVLVTDRDHLAQQPDREALAGVDVRLLAAPGQLDGRVDAGTPEHEEDPLEGADDGDAGSEEDRPEDERPDHAEEEHPVLVLTRAP